MRLCQYKVWKKDILHPGVYEIGFVRNGVFNPKYIGKASFRIYDRIKKHYNEVGSLIVASYYDERIRDNLYFHVMITENYDSIERNLLRRFKIGKEGGLYEWNQKYED
ncbi:MAG: hypothetical protein HOP23_05135 [Methylococcaceae bacterium]|nr:hypothetical protein [Methylococcaceae bacterium]